MEVIRETMKGGLSKIKGKNGKWKGKKGQDEGDRREKVMVA